MKLGQKVSRKTGGFRDETGIKSTETRWPYCVAHAH